jgi:hypothetical protein
VSRCQTLCVQPQTADWRQVSKLHRNKYSTALQLCGSLHRLSQEVALMQTKGLVSIVRTSTPRPAHRVHRVFASVCLLPSNDVPNR